MSNKINKLKKELKTNSDTLIQNRSFKGIQKHLIRNAIRNNIPLSFSQFEDWDIILECNKLQILKLEQQRMNVCQTTYTDLGVIQATSDNVNLNKYNYILYNCNRSSKNFCRSPNIIKGNIINLQ